MTICLKEAALSFIASDFRTYKSLLIMNAYHIVVMSRSRLFILINTSWLKFFLHRVNSSRVHEFWVIVSGTSGSSTFMWIDKWLEPEEVLGLFNDLRRYVVVLWTWMLYGSRSFIFVIFDVSRTPLEQLEEFGTWSMQLRDAMMDLTEVPKRKQQKKT